MPGTAGSVGFRGRRRAPPRACEVGGEQPGPPARGQSTARASAGLGSAHRSSPASAAAQNPCMPGQDRGQPVAASRSGSSRSRVRSTSACSSAVPVRSLRRTSASRLRRPAELRAAAIPSRVGRPVRGEPGGRSRRGVQQQPGVAVGRVQAGDGSAIAGQPVVQRLPVRSAAPSPPGRRSRRSRGTPRRSRASTGSASRGTTAGSGPASAVTGRQAPSSAQWATGESRGTAAATRAAARACAHWAGSSPTPRPRLRDARRAAAGEGGERGGGERPGRAQVRRPAQRDQHRRVRAGGVVEQCGDRARTRTAPAVGQAARPGDERDEHRGQPVVQGGGQCPGRLRRAVVPRSARVARARPRSVVGGGPPGQQPPGLARPGPPPPRARGHRCRPDRCGRRRAARGSRRSAPRDAPGSPAG